MSVNRLARSLAWLGSCRLRGRAPAAARLVLFFFEPLSRAGAAGPEDGPRCRPEDVRAGLALAWALCGPRSPSACLHTKHRSCTTTGWHQSHLVKVARRDFTCPRASQAAAADRAPWRAGPTTRVTPLTPGQGWHDLMLLRARPPRASSATLQIRPPCPLTFALHVSD